MRPSIRFLAVAVVGWAGIRAMTLDAFPGGQIFSIERSEAKSPPPIIPTQFPPIETTEPPYSPTEYYGQNGQPWPIQMQPVQIPIYFAAASAPSSPPGPLASTLSEIAPQFDSAIPGLRDWSVSSLPPMSALPARSVVVPIQSRPPAARSQLLDRVQLSAWALLRGQQGMALGTPSLAPHGTLGGSQAGARLTYNVTRQLAASFRTTTDVGRRGAEIAAGMRVQPIGSVPVWFTAERRQRIGDGTGRNAFALFAESGIYQQPMPWQFDLDAYLQAGVVGFRTRDAFIDGGAAMTRPLYRQFTGGFGLWGAAQPGVYRIDGGPRLTMKVRDNLRVHFDWRQRLAGNAAPGSGPAITLAGDF